MSPGEEEDVGDDTDGVNGTGSEGTPGADPAGGDTDADVSAGHPDDAADDGQSDDEIDATLEARPSRGETRFQRLANETKAAKAEAEAARREATELRRAQFAQSQQLTEQQERERLMLMTPEERSEYRVTQAERRMQQTIAQSEFRTQDAVDKAGYDAKATLNPVYARYQEEVESQLQGLRNNGQNVPRENILRFILGDRALKGATASGKKAATNGQKRVAAQQVRASSSKGDAAAERGGRQATTAEARLKDQFI